MSWQQFPLFICPIFLLSPSTPLLWWLCCCPRCCFLFDRSAGGAFLQRWELVCAQGGEAGPSVLQPSGSFPKALHFAVTCFTQVSLEPPERSRWRAHHGAGARWAQVLRSFLQNWLAVWFLFKLPSPAFWNLRRWRCIASPRTSILSYKQGIRSWLLGVCHSPFGKWGFLALSTPCRGHTSHVYLHSTSTVLGKAFHLLCDLGFQPSLGCIQKRSLFLIFFLACG